MQITFSKLLIRQKYSVSIGKRLAKGVLLNYLSIHLQHEVRNLNLCWLEAGSNI